MVHIAFDARPHFSCLPDRRWEREPNLAGLYDLQRGFHIQLSHSVDR